MVIVGLDPGSLCTGYAVIATEGLRIRRLDGGTLKPPRGEKLSVRLWMLHEGLRDLLRRVNPDALAIEECFMGRHARAALVLGHARGALMVAAMSADVPLFEYAPRLVKMAATGVGGASKEQIQAMMPHLVEGVPERLSPDEADALAVAVCHAHRALPASGDSSLREVFR